jgi:hypothetical protein
MFLSPNFLRYGKPVAAAAPIMLALTGMPAPAHACTGNADDPAHCINNLQTITGFTEFFDSNLAGLPGATGVPGDRAPGGSVRLSGGVGVGFESGEEKYLFGNSGLSISAVTDISLTAATDNGLTFSGVTDNGLKIGSDIQLEGGDIGGSIEEYNAFVSGSFGSIRIGEGYDVGNQGFSLGASDDLTSGAVFRPQITLDNGLTIGVDMVSGSGAAVGVPEGSDEPVVRHFEPRFAGFQIGVNYDRTNTGTDNPDPTFPRDTRGTREWNVRDTYLSGFDGLNVGLSENWGVDSAATNFAVGQASVAGYGELEGVKIGRIDYVPLDDFGLHVDYNIDGSITTTDTNTGETLRGTAGGAAPSPAPVTPPPVTGTQVGSMDFASQGQRAEVNLIRTEDGKTHAVDKETGHDFGTVHESRSGFGWSFDNPPVPAPAPATPAAADPIATLDQKTLFSDGSSPATRPPGASDRTSSSTAPLNQSSAAKGSHSHTRRPGSDEPGTGACSINASGTA